MDLTVNKQIRKRKKERCTFTLTRLITCGNLWISKESNGIIKLWSNDFYEMMVYLLYCCLKSSTGLKRKKQQFPSCSVELPSEQSWTQISVETSRVSALYLQTGNATNHKTVTSRSQFLCCCRSEKPSSKTLTAKDMSVYIWHQVISEVCGQWYDAH